jgi:hypothetical protein
MSGIVSTANRIGIASSGKPTDRKTGVIGAKNDAPLGNPTPPILMNTDIKPTVAICKGLSAMSYSQATKKDATISQIGVLKRNTETASGRTTPVT